MSDASILVVDDEPDIRNLVKEILEDEGYRRLLLGHLRALLRRED